MLWSFKRERQHWEGQDGEVAFRSGWEDVHECDKQDREVRAEHSIKKRVWGTVKNPGRLKDRLHRND